MYELDQLVPNALAHKQAIRGLTALGLRYILSETKVLVWSSYNFPVGREELK